MGFCLGRIQQSWIFFDKLILISVNRKQLRVCVCFFFKDFARPYCSVSYFVWRRVEDDVECTGRERTIINSLICSPGTLFSLILLVIVNECVISVSNMWLRGAVLMRNVICLLSDLAFCRVCNFIAIHLNLVQIFNYKADLSIFWWWGATRFSWQFVHLGLWSEWATGAAPHTAAAAAALALAPLKWICRLHRQTWEQGEECQVPSHELL